MFYNKKTFKSFAKVFGSSKIEKIFNLINKVELDFKFNLLNTNSLSNGQIVNCFNQEIGKILLHRRFLSFFIFISIFFKLKFYILPLPNIYLNKFNAHGIKINRFLSSILFRIFSLLYLFKYFIKNFKTIFKSLKKINNNESIFLHDDLTDNIISPQYRRNLSSWIFLKFKCKKIYTLSKYINFENKQITHIKNNLCQISYLNLIYLILLNFYLFFYFLLLQFSRIHFHTFFYEQLILYLAFKVIDKKSFYNKYIFTTSSMNTKPLWAHYLENNKLSEIIFINYSCSYQYNDRINIQYGLPRQDWKVRYELDNSYITFLRGLLSVNPSFIHDKTIKFSDSNEKIPFKNYILIFDHLVWDYSSLAKNLVVNDDFLDINAAKFIRDLISISKKLNLQLILKTKKRIPANEKYHKFLLRMQIKYKNFFNIIYDKSIYELSKNSRLCITYPFTSSAVMAANFSNNSIFYDFRSKYSDKKHNMNYGLKTIFGKKNLISFLKNSL